MTLKDYYESDDLFTRLQGAALHWHGWYTLGATKYDFEMFLDCLAENYRVDPKDLRLLIEATGPPERG